MGATCRLGVPHPRRPDEPTYKTLVSNIERSLDSAATAKPNPGRTDTFRRLNRTEYQNAIRDLLAVDLTPIMPTDEASSGFDNVTVGNLSARPRPSVPKARITSLAPLSIKLQPNTSGRKRVCHPWNLLWIC